MLQSYLKNLKINKYAIHALAAIFIAAEVVFYIIMHTKASFDQDTSVIRYISVVTCFAFAFIFINNGRESFAVVIALVFTLCADYWLVACETNYYEAMIFFNFTQIFYAIKLLMMAKKRERIITLIIRITVIIIGEIISVIVTKDAFDALAFVSIIYFMNLCCSVVIAGIHIKKQPLFFFGLFFFLLCDICVWTMSGGQYTALATLPVLHYIVDIENILWAWIFYVPSQTMLALCTLKKTEKLFPAA